MSRHITLSSSQRNNIQPASDSEISTELNLDSEENFEGTDKT